MINDYFFQQKQINWHMNEHETEISKLVNQTRNREADVKTDFRKTLVLIDGREFREGWRQCEHIYYVPATSEHDYGRYFVIFNKRVRHEVPVSSVLFLKTELFEVADADSDEEFIGRTD